MESARFTANGQRATARFLHRQRPTSLTAWLIFVGGWPSFCLVDPQSFQLALRCFRTGVVDADMAGEPHGKDLSSIAALRMNVFKYLLTYPQKLFQVKS